jgi:integrase
MTGYLQKRRRRWYAVLEIPKSLRPHFGRTRFLQSLGTDSLSVAQRRVGPLIASWRTQIARAREEPEDDAVYFRHALANARSDKQREMIMEQIDMAAWDIGAVNVDNVGEAPSSAPEAAQFYLRATGHHTNFTDHIDEWLELSSVTEKTKDMRRADVSRFAEKFPIVQEITRKSVQSWVLSLVQTGMAPQTAQRTISGLRGYWRYLQSIEVAPEDALPFERLEIPKRQSRKQSSYRPFDPSEVLTLLDHAVKKNDTELSDLIRLGMWSGCRIEELCALKVVDVKGNFFSVTDAKTAAGRRDVPIHSELATTISSLIGTRKGGYVLKTLTPNKYGDRSNAIGKRFGRLKREAGFSQSHVFHSIRKTVVTILENKGVTENIVADIVGHEKPRITYGLYSGGTSLDVKAKALRKLRY